MKNLMIYINPAKEFEKRNCLGEVKIQIENSFSLGWKKEDMVLVTNFEFEHQGFKAKVVPDNLWCDYWKQMSKMNALIHMFESNMIGDDLYWFHDIDAFQTVPISLDLKKDAGFTGYGYMDKMNTGSFFFKRVSYDLMRTIRDRAYELRTDEERSFEDLIRHNTGNIRSRFELLNITYNFPGSRNGEKNFKLVYDRSELPVKVLHFHPFRHGGRYYRLMNGENALNISLVPKRLSDIFKKYGFT